MAGERLEPLQATVRPTTATSGSRRREAIYAGLLVAGVALPFAQALPWLGEHGLDLPRFFAELFATRISAFFGWDVIVAVLTLLVLMAIDHELRPRQRLAVAVASCLGASVGLPLYLLLRERTRAQADRVSR